MDADVKKPIRKNTPAERMAILQDLLEPRYIGEDGIEYIGEPLITKEQAFALINNDDE